MTRSEMVDALLIGLTGLSVASIPVNLHNAKPVYAAGNAAGAYSCAREVRRRRGDRAFIIAENSKIKALESKLLLRFNELADSVEYGDTTDLERWLDSLGDEDLEYIFQSTGRQD